ncbi:hypothetical protein AWB69_05722 [Caballeronia udeis]|uniref:Uncharacterized protein n=1 Tax=Caballeronia udeis TaxID=1232866 RepID=A0A158ICN1_9BURK|nr:hypothetical protein AWB69_05722 [Caballeronia udeis]
MRPKPKVILEQQNKKTHSTKKIVEADASCRCSFPNLRSQLLIVNCRLSDTADVGAGSDAAHGKICASLRPQTETKGYQLAYHATITRIDSSPRVRSGKI